MIHTDFTAMLVKTRAIVLHAFRYGETKLIVDAVTADYGRMSLIAAVSKSPRGKLKKQYFQPLFILEIVVDLRRRPGLQPLKEARVAVPYASVPFEPLKLSVAMFTAEFVRAATRREQLDPLTFAYIENSLRWLDGSTGGFANFHVVFMMRLTRFLGFYPNTDGYTEGSWFDLRAASFAPDAPLHHDRLAPDEARKVNLLLRMNFATMHLFRMTRAERNRMTEIIIRYYELHLPDFHELKSFDVVKEIFS